MIPCRSKMHTRIQIRVRREIKQDMHYILRCVGEIRDIRLKLGSICIYLYLLITFSNWFAAYAEGVFLQVSEGVKELSR